MWETVCVGGRYCCAIPERGPWVAPEERHDWLHDDPEHGYHAHDRVRVVADEVGAVVEEALVGGDDGEGHHGQHQGQGHEAAVGLEPPVLAADLHEERELESNSKNKVLNSQQKTIPHLRKNKLSHTHSYPSCSQGNCPQ